MAVSCGHVWFHCAVLRRTSASRFPVSRRISRHAWITLCISCACHVTWFSVKISENNVNNVNSGRQRMCSHRFVVVKLLKVVMILFSPLFMRYCVVSVEMVHYGANKCWLLRCKRGFLYYPLNAKNGVVDFVAPCCVCGIYKELWGGQMVKRPALPGDVKGVCDTTPKMEPCRSNYIIPFPYWGHLLYLEQWVGKILAFQRI